MINKIDLKKYISSNVKRIREDRKFTQAYVAQQIGINVVNYSKIENGHILPSIEVIYTLADLFHVSADVFRQLPAKTTNSKKYSKTA